jgi:uncharacterized membrane protein YozB (DUF420 family)
MESKEAALSGTEYTRMYWIMDYFFAGVVFLIRMKQLAEIWSRRPLDSLSIVTNSLGLLYCFLPLLVGIWFRRTLKAELHREMMNTRTYVICNWRIAQLLFIVYLGMLIFSERA